MRDVAVLLRKSCGVSPECYEGRDEGMSLRLLKFSGGSVDYAICRSS